DRPGEPEMDPEPGPQGPEAADQGPCEDHQERRENGQGAGGRGQGPAGPLQEQQQPARGAEGEGSEGVGPSRSAAHGGCLAAQAGEHPLARSTRPGSASRTRRCLAVEQEGVNMWESEGAPAHPAVQSLSSSPFHTWSSIRMHAIKQVLDDTALTGTTVTVAGWVRTFRNDRFIALNDGSTIRNLQCVIDQEQVDARTRARFTTGASVRCTGELTPSQGGGQRVEMKVTAVEVLGDSPADKYPIQPKKHSLEFLREHAHLRFRTNTYSAIFRIRHQVSFGIHEHFDSLGYNYFHSPIITASDAEGAGEMFRVSTLDAKQPPLNEAGEVDFKQDFFGAESHLTVSGQLQAETAALALGKVYTFGPTFRAENSNTTRHLAEFWMVEPEAAFMDLHGDMDLAEGLCKHLIARVLKNSMDDLQFLDARLAEEEKQKPQAQRGEMGLIARLK